ncbi:chemotaxis protein CheW [Phormidium tenue FACHB-886]|nr:chemotaxis protein CheW [Phormidium tenue FACHB-886]
MPDALSDALFDAPLAPELQQAVGDAGQDPAVKPVSEQFLRLQLASEITVLFPVQQLTEVLTLAVGQIVPLPHMPAWVMGVYNWRGEILWMVDLGHLCGLTPWYQQIASASSLSAVVLDVASLKSASSQALGLVVSHVEDIEWLDPNLIQFSSTAGISSAASSNPEVMAKLAPFLWGHWQQSEENEDAIAVLDGKAIVAAVKRGQ